MTLRAESLPVAILRIFFGLTQCLIKLGVYKKAPQGAGGLFENQNVELNNFLVEPTNVMVA